MSMRTIMAFVAFFMLVSTGMGYNFIVAGTIHDTIEQAGYMNTVLKSPSRDGYMISMGSDDMNGVYTAIGATSAGMVYEGATETSFIGYPVSTQYMTTISITPQDATVIMEYVASEDVQAMFNYVQGLTTQQILI